MRILIYRTRHFFLYTVEQENEDGTRYIIYDVRDGYDYKKSKSLFQSCDYSSCLDYMTERERDI